ncbi:MAG TPA: hypothetical protein VMT81_02280, partial [Candidatus Paceibacterota bacterium]|nr:hypothetical protein [Candidatus Paceibacterota bacterium]
MNFIRKHYKALLAIAITVVVMNVISSVIFAADSFDGFCYDLPVMGGVIRCSFLQYYAITITANPFVNPFRLFID